MHGSKRAAENERRQPRPPRCSHPERRRAENEHEQRRLVCDVRGRVVDEDQHCCAGNQAERVAGRTHDHHLEAAITLPRRAHSTGAAIDCDELPVGKGRGAGARAHDRRDAVLPGDNSGMRAWPSAVGDHSGGALEQGGPGWFVCGQTGIARGEPAELRGHGSALPARSPSTAGRGP